MKTLIIVIIILLCVLTTPLSLKRVIDRNKDKYSKGWPGPSNVASGTGAGAMDAGVGPVTDPAGSRADAADAVAGPAGSRANAADAVAGPAGSSADASDAAGPAGSSADASDAGSCAGTGAAGSCANPDLPNSTADPYHAGASSAGRPATGSDSDAADPDSLFPIIFAEPLDDETLQHFDSDRSLLPVFNLDRAPQRTAAKFDAGISTQLRNEMQRLASLCIPFGVCITVTTETLRPVTSQGFAEDLQACGCQVIFYILYTAASDADAHLEPGEADLALMALRLQDLRKAHEDMSFLLLSGGEKTLPEKLPKTVAKTPIQ